MNIDDAAVKAGYTRRGSDLLHYKCFRDALGIGFPAGKRKAKRSGAGGVKTKTSETDIADSSEVLRMLTSVMRGGIREPVVVLEQLTGTSGKTERAARVIEKSASVKERMSAAEMLARRYGILDGDGEESVLITGEEALLGADYSGYDEEN